MDSFVPNRFWKQQPYSLVVSFRASVQFVVVPALGKRAGQLVAFRYHHPKQDLMGGSILDVLSDRQLDSGLSMPSLKAQSSSSSK